MCRSERHQHAPGLTHRRARSRRVQGQSRHRGIGGRRDLGSETMSARTPRYRL
jgi:hypothetical protein